MEEHNPSPIVKVIAFGYDPAPELESFVRGLHRYRTEHLPHVWQLTIADNGSSDGTWPLAVSLANDLPSTRAVRIEQRLGRRNSDTGGTTATL